MARLVAYVPKIQINRTGRAEVHQGIISLRVVDNCKKFRADIYKSLVIINYQPRLELWIDLSIIQVVRISQSPFWILILLRSKNPEILLNTGDLDLKTGTFLYYVEHLGAWILLQDLTLEKAFEEFTQRRGWGSENQICRLHNIKSFPKKISRSYHIDCFSIPSI